MNADKEIFTLSIVYNIVFQKDAMITYKSIETKKPPVTKQTVTIKFKLSF